jgi:hypothetical protein
VRLGRKTRLNIRIDPALLHWVRIYASSKGTTVTGVITTCLKRLKTRSERGGGVDDIPQL